MASSMLAAVFMGPDRIEMRDLPIPEIGPSDLLVKVRAAAVCGTDVRIIQGKKTKGVRIPSILGHELAGEVAKAGARVDGWREGDAIAVAPVLACGRCRYCVTGMASVCLNRRAIGYEYDGAFAEFVRIPEEMIAAGNAFPIPSGVSYREACLAEPLSCCVHGQRRMAIQPGASVLVAGAGPIGLMHLKLARRLGCGPIIVSDPSESRRAHAVEAGADCVVDPRDADLASTVRELTGGHGAEFAIMAVSAPGIVGDLLACLQKGGVLSLFAGSEAAAVDANGIHYSELHVVGSSASDLTDYRTALKSIVSGEVSVSDLITHAYLLSEFPAGLANAMSGSGLKTIFVS